ncbi:MAG: DUF4915 domain-containing protein [Planctomycetaceae bacterium]
MTRLRRSHRNCALRRVRLGFGAGIAVGIARSADAGAGVCGLQSGIPITERTQERTCGVWAIHIQTGEILGSVKFEDAVQEIFAVRVVPGIRFPELVNHDMKLLDGSFVLPDADLLRAPQTYRVTLP